MIRNIALICSLMFIANLAHAKNNACVDNIEKHYRERYRDAPPQLTMISCQLSDNDIAPILKFIRSKKGSVYLSFRNNNIGPEGARQLATYELLSTIDLYDNNIQDEGAAFLAKNKSIDVLYLGRNHIGDAGALAISMNPKIDYVGLQDNQIGDAGAIAISMNGNVLSVDLDNNHVGDKGIAALSGLQKLKYLFISNNHFTVEGAKALGKNQTISSLGISYNQLDDKAAAFIAQMSNLDYILANNNNFGNEGARLIISAVRAYPRNNFLHIDLSNNHISDGNALISPAKAYVLRINNNQLGEKGALILSQQKNITYLEVNDNQIGDQGFAALAQLPKLYNLHAENNGISAIGVQEFTRTLNVSSLTLYLNNNPIGDEGFASLATLSTKMNVDGIHATGAHLTDKGAIAFSQIAMATLRPIGVDVRNNTFSQKGIAALRHFAEKTNSSIFVDGEN